MASPIDVPASHVVRVQVVKDVYFSPVMPPAEAELELRDQVLDDADILDQAFAISAAMRFHHEPTGFSLGDAWDWHVTEFSVFFLWCCFAIVEGIRQYRAVQAVAA